MEKFTITTILSSKDYAKIMLLGLYKKPSFILIAIFGLYLIITNIFVNATSYYNMFPNFGIPVGLFFLLSPFLITIIAVRQFASNPSFKKENKFSFDDTGITVEGQTFKGEFVWAHIIKVKEIGKFLILYHSKRMGNFIDKTSLTSDQLKFIKSKIKSVNSAANTR